MPQTKVTFSFPDDAWPGICEAFASEYQRPETVQQDGETIENPETKENHAARKVIEYVGEIWGAYNKKQNLRTAEQAVDAAIAARKAEVEAATTVNVETVE